MREALPASAKREDQSIVVFNSYVPAACQEQIVFSIITVLFQGNVFSCPPPAVSPFLWDDVGRSQKGSGGRGLLQKREETIMQLYTRFNLASIGTYELKGLYRKIFNALANITPGTAEHRAALTSLKNIQAEIASRVPRL